MRFLALTAIIFYVSLATASSQFQPYIVGGMDAVKGEFPFMVSFQSDDFNGHFCGGTLIKKNWVLTAGHCAKYIQNSKVLIGLHDQSNKGEAQTFTVKQVIPHPQFDINTMDYDFSLVELNGDASQTPAQINRTEIPLLQNQSTPLMATAIGWGVTQEGAFAIPNILQKVELPLVSKTVCDASYSGKITDRMLCAGLAEGGKDACQGDSGGPLVMADSNGSFKLVGVVSWGKGCAERDNYGVYSKVNSVVDWIDATVGTN